MSKVKHWRDAMHERNQDWINSKEKPKGQEWHGGKGSYSRKVNTTKYRSNWDRIFGDGDATSTTKESDE